MSTKEQLEEDFLNQEAMERKWRDEFENSFPTMDFSYSNLFYKNGEVNRYWAIYITAKRLAQAEIDRLTDYCRGSGEMIQKRDKLLEQAKILMTQNTHKLSQEQWIKDYKELK